MLERRLGIAHQLVEELRSLGESLAVRTEADVRAGQDIGGVILEVARSTQRDLIILGTSVRPGSDRLYLGPRVERILREASCPVLVLNV